MTFDQWLENEIGPSRMRALIEPLARMVWQAAQREVPGNAAELLAVCQTADGMLRKYGGIHPWYTIEDSGLRFADQLKGAIMRACAIRPDDDAGKGIAEGGGR